MIITFQSIKINIFYNILSECFYENKLITMDQCDEKCIEKSSIGLCIWVIKTEMCFCISKPTVCEKK